MNPVVFAFKFSPFLFITCVFAAILGFSMQSGATEQDNPDRYHSRNGFSMSRAGLSAYMIDKEAGLIGSLFAPVIHDE